MRRWQFWFSIAAAGALGGCAKSTVAGPPTDLIPEGGTGGRGGVDGAGVGEACADTDACRAGLVCEAGVCELGRTTEEGDACVVAGECLEGLQCVQGACVSAGEALEGETCQTDADCSAGLRCDIAGLGLSCIAEGSADLGADCDAGPDCLAGLVCLEQECSLPVQGLPPFSIPTWEGVECEPPAETNIRAYFEVPGASGSDSDEFFRLPFPNDIRLRDARPDLTGFPTPGTGPGGLDLVALYVDAVSHDTEGWSAYPTVYFRFSGPVDFDTFRLDEGGAPPNWVDVTAGADEYGSSAGDYYSWDPNDRKYICHSSISVRRPLGEPLMPGHTYAVWLSTDNRDANGNRIERAPQFEAMLSAEVPDDPALVDAHERYAPLRDYLADDAVQAPHPDDILNATVFTVGPIRDPMAELADAVAAADVPTAASWVKCAAETQSPCPQADADRACGEGTDDFDEYHALVSLPVFQVGTAPYSDHGGAIEPGEPQRIEQVCLALTVPKSTSPASGWPLVVYAHGTGGSFRSHINDSVAGALARATTPSGDAVPFAVLGIDQVVHGTRRGDSTESPNTLWANFTNPDAARGNPLQGAADQLALARFVEGLDVSAAESGGDPIRVDPNAIVFFGHSQGATEGSLALAYTNTYRAAVLSGNGGAILFSLLGKTRPENIAAGLPLAVADVNASGELPGGDMHPVLSLIQHFMDPADPLNFAGIIAHQPLDSHTPTHLLAPYGLNDSYSPPNTLAAFAIAARADQAEADASVDEPDEIRQLAPVPVPLAGNATVDSVDVTIGMRQYAAPEDSDGHFVVFDVESANADAVRFLAMAAAGEVPQVGE